MTTPDIFLSYNCEDAAVAKRYADAFAAEGLNVWWDTALRSGEAYDEVTEAALRGAKAVVVLWSPRSVVSRWVRAEATIADRCKTLVPVTIEPCERPIIFELTQTADLAHWTGDAGDRAWLSFLSDVRRFVGREIETPAALPEPKPPEPTKPGERGEAPSLAVLPFTNRSGLPEDEVFAIGMVEDLIDALARRVYFRVVSNSATARFRTGAIPDVEAMGRQLGVRYLLEGNVRRVGSDLRVTAQLVEAAQGDILWTQKFDRPLAELAALQEDLIVEVAANLGVQLFRHELSQSLKKPDDLTAWQLVTRAIAAYRKMTPASIAEAQAAAEQAVAIAPDYGPAHAILAMTLGVPLYWGGNSDPAGLVRVARHVDSALALDAENAVVQAYAGMALSNSGRPQDGLRCAEQAIRLSPNFGFGYYACGSACEFLGRTTEALAHYEDFLRIEPQSPHEYMVWYRMGRTHLLREDWTAAAAAIAQSISLNDSSPLAQCWGALAACHLGQADDARAMMAKSRRLDPVTTLADWERRLNLWHSGSATLEDLLTHLRALWAETEPT